LKTLFDCYQLSVDIKTEPLPLLKIEHMADVTNSAAGQSIPRIMFRK